MEIEDYRFSFREKDGGIQLILSYKCADGKWRQKSKQGFKTKDAARRYKNDLLTVMRDECAKNPAAVMTLRAFFEDYFMPSLAPSVAYSTAEKYGFTINYLRPLCDMPLDVITAADVQKQYSRIAAHYSPSTARAAMRFCKRLFNSAVFPFEFIAENPARLIPARISDKTKKRVKALTTEQLETLLNCLKAHDITFYTFAALLAFAGLRFSEGAGLCWSCVNFEMQEIEIKAQYSKVAKSQKELTQLKTLNSYRKIPLSPRLAGILKEYKKEGYSDSFVFPPELLTYWTFRKAMRKYAPGFSPHALRHTFATRLLQRGADVQTVAALIGDTVALTVKTYINFNDDMRRAAADFVDKASK